MLLARLCQRVPFSVFKHSKAFERFDHFDVSVAGFRLRAYCSKQPQKNRVVNKSQGGDVSTTVEKVKRVGKDVGYVGIIIVGMACTGLIFYAIGRELLSSDSSSSIYSQAVKDCKKNTELVSVLGEPIKSYGETTRRGRRRHVLHSEYENDGQRYMRMRFYMEGPSGKATVHLEVKKSPEDKCYRYRYLFADIESYPARTIIIEDNR